jgi:hypothetical protein
MNSDNPLRGILIPAILVLIGATLGGYSQWTLKRAHYDREPINIPVELRTGNIWLAGAMIHESGQYEISLLIPDRDEWQVRCLLGANDEPQRCAAVKGTLDVDWRLLISGKVIASGSSGDTAGRISDAPLRRVLGTVALEAGKPYVLRAHSRSDAESLDAYRPRLAMTSFDTNILERETRLSALSALAALIGFPGLAMLMRYMYAHRSQRDGRLKRLS